jgi:hypothetical protein
LNTCIFDFNIYICTLKCDYIFKLNAQIFIHIHKLNCYMFHLNAIWMFTYLNCLNVVSNIWYFMCLICKEWVKRAYTSWNVHPDFMTEYIITKYGKMKWHEKIFKINNAWVNVHGCPLFFLCAMNSIVVQKINKVWKKEWKGKWKKCWWRWSIKK